MKLICPHCGLGGTAHLRLFGKKIKCPECKKVFIFNDEVVLQHDPESATNKGNDKKAYVIPKVEPVGVFAACSLCGYRLNRQFMRTVDGKLCCSVCIPD